MSLKRLKNGKWQYRWRDSAGIQRAKNFRSKELAHVFVRELLSAPKEDGTKVPDVTFGDFADTWHARYCKVHKAESQWGTDWQLIKKHLLPAFGPRILSDLKKKDLLFLQSSLKAQGRHSVKTINLIVGLARKMMATALDWEMVLVNPWAGVKLLKQPEQPFDYWSTEERDRFLRFCYRENPDLAEVVELACHTGLRQGEIRGLLRDCIDFERRVIVVRRAWCRDGGKLQNHTKGKTIRYVEINAAAWKILQGKRLLPPTAELFKFNPQHMARSIQRVAKAAEVKQIRFHDLRHTFASHLAMAGVPLQKIQYLLGHVDYKQTLRYAHLTPTAMTGVTAMLVSASNVHSEEVRSASGGSF